MSLFKAQPHSAYVFCTEPAARDIFYSSLTLIFPTVVCDFFKYNNVFELHSSANMIDGLAVQ